MESTENAKGKAKGVTRIVAVVAVAAVMAALVPGPARAAGDDQDPSETLIVRFESGVNDATARREVDRAGARWADHIPRLGAVIIRVPRNHREAALRALASREDVVYVEPEVLGRVDSTIPNDPLWPQQWGLVDTRAVKGWEKSMGDPSVVLAVADTGVDSSHPDLTGKLVSGYNFYDGNTNTADVHGHGTGVAGIVGAKTNNGAGVASMCRRCSIMPLRVGDANGSIPFSKAASAVVWATDNGADVINMSFSGSSASQVLGDAVEYAHSRGVVLVGSAGNKGDTDVRYPSGFPQVIAVAASQEDGTRRPSSTYGSWVDVAAPGSNQTTERGGGYRTFSGTSSAAPMVAGLAGLALSADSQASPNGIADAIRQGSVPVNYVAAGRVDASASLTLLAGSEPSESEPSESEPSEPSEPSGEEVGEETSEKIGTDDPATTVKWFRGRVTKKRPMRRFRMKLAKGKVTIRTAFRSKKRLTVRLVSSSGKVIAQKPRRVPFQISRRVPAGTYRIVVRGKQTRFRIKATNIPV